MEGGKDRVLPTGEQNLLNRAGLFLFILFGIFLSFKFVGKTESKTDLKFASVLESDRGTLTVVVGNMDARFKAYRLKLNESVKINDSELDMVLFVNGEPAEVWLYDGSVYKVTEWVELPVEVVEGM